jgi:hypothetical protein
MDKRYCIVKEIDGIPTIDNIVMATDEVAKERGYQDIPEGQIGMQNRGGKFVMPDKPEVKPTPRFEERLVSLLCEKKILTELEAQQLKKG